MSYQAITLEKKERVGVITLNRPEKFNTFSTPLAQELNESLRRLDKDDEVRVIIVKGAGR